MDTRRLLSLACVGVLLSGCATLRSLAGLAATTEPAPTAISAVATANEVSASPPAWTFTPMAPIPDPARTARSAATPLMPQARVAEARPALAAAGAAEGRPRLLAAASRGRTAIAAANANARETSRSEGFVGGMQVFSYEPGRVYEVWTAPLRVTTLTLAPSETIVSKAAGDTVRWQIGETTSGQGPSQRAHVMIKPLERGLETNLVLATNQRVYLLQLKSGPADAFNAAVSWDFAAALAPTTPSAGDDPAAVGPEPLVTPAGPLDARFRIEPRRGRPPWTPTAVMTDGVHTFLTFPPSLGAGEAPGLYVVGPDGAAQMVNYRQQDGLWVVDRVLERAELRLGDKHPAIVRITHDGAAS